MCYNAVTLGGDYDGQRHSERTTRARSGAQLWYIIKTAYIMQQKNCMLSLFNLVIIRPNFGRILQILYGPKERPSRVLAMADFGRDPHSSDSLEGSRNFVCFCCEVNNARFHRSTVGHIFTTFEQLMWQLNITY